MLMGREGTSGKGEESELRRKAMESLLKNKEKKMRSSSSGDGDASKKKEDYVSEEEPARVNKDDAMEDGELPDEEWVDSGMAGASATRSDKSKWADDDGEVERESEGGKKRSPGEAPDSQPAEKRQKADDYDKSPSSRHTPMNIPPPPPLPAAEEAKDPVVVTKKKSKWAEESDDEEDSAPSVPAAALKIATPTSKSGEQAASQDGSSKDADMLSKATAAGDSLAALDMLEERLRRQRGGGAPGGGEQGDGAEAAADGGTFAEEGEGAAGGEEVDDVLLPGATSIKKLHRCREVDKAYQKLNKIDEGTYGVVYRAKCRVTEKIVALKQVKLERAKEGFPLTALRELTVLLGLRHRNIVHVHEVVTSPKKQVFMVMEYMEHDFRSLMENMHRPFRASEVKCLIYQLLSGTEFMHRHWVIHRDLKTSNLLLDNQGNLKICDFGLARMYRDPTKVMTNEVVTLWYRAPEILFGEKKYTIAIDMWSVGCIFGELVLKEPLLRGRTDQEQRDKIVELMGTPDEDNWPDFKLLPGAKNVRYKKKACALRERIPKVSYTGGPSLSDLGYDILLSLLCYDPKRRMTALEALEECENTWFKEPPHPLKPEDMPTFPSSHEAPKGAAKKKMANRSPVDTEGIADFYDDAKRYERRD